MPNATWKAAERRAAALFGARRRPLSGSHQGGGRDDAIHPRLFVSCKQGRSVPGAALMAAEASKAKREGKVPVIYLQPYRREPMLLCRVKDFPDVILEYLKANPEIAACIVTALYGKPELGGQSK